MQEISQVWQDSAGVPECPRREDCEKCDEKEHGNDDTWIAARHLEGISGYEDSPGAKFRKYSGYLFPGVFSHASFLFLIVHPGNYPS